MRKIVAVAAALATCSVSLAALAQRPPPPEPPRPPPPEMRPPPPPPPAPPPPMERPAPPVGEVVGAEREWGDQGIIAIGGDTTANVGYTNTSPPGGAPSTNNLDLNLAPNIQYFVVEGISVGGTLLFDWNKPNKGDATTTFGIGPTVGYNLWLSPGSLSLWPQATFLFETASGPFGTSSTGASLSGTETLMNVGVKVPLLIHPVKHFHFGVGPYFDIDVSNKASSGGASADLPKNMHVGIAFEVAGWL